MNLNLKYEIVGVEEWVNPHEHVNFIVAVTNRKGMHYAKYTKQELLGMLEKEVEFEIDEGHKELYHIVHNMNLDFMEIAEYTEGGKTVFDAYVYTPKIEDGVLKIDYDREESWFFKSFKYAKSAESYAKRRRIEHIFYT